MLEEIPLKFLRRLEMTDNIEKIQYFTADLEHILKIGTIKEMHVAEVNGRTVLRITCGKYEEDEYKTIGAGGVKKPVKKPQNQTGSPESTSGFGSGIKKILSDANSNPNPFSEKNWAKKDKPDWMR